MTAPELDTWLAASRAASGVPAKVEDEGTLLTVAYRLVALVRSQHGGASPGKARRRTGDRSGAAATKGRSHGSP
jgi:hypothetical protein